MKDTKRRQRIPAGGAAAVFASGIAIVVLAIMPLRAHAAVPLSVRLQEPAAASNISVQPDLGAGVPGPDGLHYWTVKLGACEAGTQLRKYASDRGVLP